MNFTPNKPTRPDEPNAVSHATSMVDLSLASIPEDGENFTAMLKTVKQSIDHSITSTSANTAAPLLSPNSEVLDEMNDKLYRYNRAQHKAEQAREDEERFERFKEPLNSLASFVYNIRIEVNPDTLASPNVLSTSLVICQYVDLEKKMSPLMLKASRYLSIPRSNMLLLMEWWIVWPITFQIS